MADWLDGPRAVCCGSGSPLIVLLCGLAISLAHMPKLPSLYQCYHTPWPPQ